MTTSRFSLDGKVALITGASKNIGRGIAANVRDRTGRRVPTFCADIGETSQVGQLAEPMLAAWNAMQAEQSA